MILSVMLAVIGGVILFVASCYLSLYFLEQQSRQQFLLKSERWLPLVIKIFGCIDEIEAKIKGKTVGIKPDLRYKLHEEMELGCKYIFRDFVKDWFDKLSSDESFLVKCSNLLASLFQNVIHHARIINTIQVIRKFVYIYKNYFTVYREAFMKYRTITEDNVRSDKIVSYVKSRMQLHPALCNRQSEHTYLRSTVHRLMRDLLPEEPHLDLEASCVFLSEIIMVNVFLQVVDLVQEPDFLGEAVIEILAETNITAEEQGVCPAIYGWTPELPASDMKKLNDVSEVRDGEMTGSNCVVEKEVKLEEEGGDVTCDEEVFVGVEASEDSQLLHSFNSSSSSSFFIVNSKPNSLSSTSSQYSDKQSMHVLMSTDESSTNSINSIDLVDHNATENQSVCESVSLKHDDSLKHDVSKVQPQEIDLHANKHTLNYKKPQSKDPSKKSAFKLNWRPRPLFFGPFLGSFLTHSVTHNKGKTEVKAVNSAASTKEDSGSTGSQQPTAVEGKLSDVETGVDATDSVAQYSCRESDSQNAICDNSSKIQEQPVQKFTPGKLNEDSSRSLSSVQNNDAKAAVRTLLKADVRAMFSESNKNQHIVANLATSLNKATILGSTPNLHLQQMSDNKETSCCNSYSVKCLEVDCSGCHGSSLLDEQQKPTFTLNTEEPVEKNVFLTQHQANISNQSQLINEKRSISFSTISEAIVESHLSDASPTGNTVNHKKGFWTGNELVPRCDATGRKLSLTSVEIGSDFWFTNIRIPRTEAAEEAMSYQQGQKSYILYCIQVSKHEIVMHVHLFLCLLHV